MFKIGDIVRFNDEGRKIYKHKMYDQTFEILWVSKDISTVKIRGYKHDFDICISYGLMMTDLEYMRNKKINRIISGK